MSIEPSAEWDFWPLEGRHLSVVTSYITYLIQFLSLWTFSIVDLGLGLVAGLGSVLVYSLNFFSFPCRLKD